MRRLVSEQRRRGFQEQWLRETRGLTAAAAAAELATGRRRDAVLCLEAGRAVLLAEVLRPA